MIGIKQKPRWTECQEPGVVWGPGIPGSWLRSVALGVVEDELHGLCGDSHMIGPAANKLGGQQRDSISPQNDLVLP